MQQQSPAPPPSCSRIETVVKDRGQGHQTHVMVGGHATLRASMMLQLFEHLYRSRHPWMTIIVFKSPDSMLGPYIHPLLDHDDRHIHVTHNQDPYLMGLLSVTLEQGDLRAPDKHASLLFIEDMSMSLYKQLLAQSVLGSLKDLRVSAVLGIDGLLDRANDDRLFWADQLWLLSWQPDYHYAVYVQASHMERLRTEFDTRVCRVARLSASVLAAADSLPRDVVSVVAGYAVHLCQALVLEDIMWRNDGHKPHHQRLWHVEALNRIAYMCSDCNTTHL